METQDKSPFEQGVEKAREMAAQQRKGFPMMEFMRDLTALLIKYGAGSVTGYSPLAIALSIVKHIEGIEHMVTAERRVREPANDNRVLVPEGVARAVEGGPVIEVAR